MFQGKDVGGGLFSRDPGPHAYLHVWMVALVHI